MDFDLCLVDSSEEEEEEHDDSESDSESEDDSLLTLFFEVDLEHTDLGAGTHVVGWE